MDAYLDALASAIAEYRESARLGEDVPELLLNEYERLRRETAARRAHCDGLRRLLDDLEEQTVAAEAALHELERLTGVADQMHIYALDHQLRGQRLLEVAVDILNRNHGPGAPIHYRAWFELIRREGYEVAGKKPLATFLTQVSRAPTVERVGARSGIYQLAVA